MSATRPESAPARASLLPSPERRERLRKIRKIRDGISRYGVGAGGIGVIFALALIFIYLFYETLPLLKPVSMGVAQSYQVPGDASRMPTMHLTLDRYEEIGARFSQSGVITFFDADTGAIRQREQVPIPEGETITSFGRSESRKRLYV
ncbi:MAG TPA: phosphate ABC transporter permease, partial [Halothiobacillus sp.]|nr:phosphate ABC transporter permease [Halothiobacillus sp.]